MRLQFEGPGSIHVRGPVTGAPYHFDDPDRELLVDPRDAVLMTRDRRFRIRSIVQLPVAEPPVSD